MAPRAAVAAAACIFALWFAGSAAAAGAAAGSAAAAASQQGGQGGSAARFRLGFTDEFVCSGSVFDEPQRFRMKCRRAPARLADCACTPPAATDASLTCSCAQPLDAAGRPAALVPAVGTVETVGLREPRG
jgi:hypothetical protein